MTPHDSERQQVLSWQLTLPRPVRAQLDPYGNILHVLTMDEPHESIVIGARGQVEIDEAREAEHESQSALPFLRFTRLTEADEALREFAKLQKQEPPGPQWSDRPHARPECAYQLSAGQHRRGNQRQ
jgi:transglutaminase-like putative cysteine protease